MINIDNSCIFKHPNPKIRFEIYYHLDIDGIETRKHYTTEWFDLHSTTKIPINIIGKVYLIFTCIKAGKKHMYKTFVDDSKIFNVKLTDGIFNPVLSINGYKADNRRSSSCLPFCTLWLDI